MQVVSSAIPGPNRPTKWDSPPPLEFSGSLGALEEGELDIHRGYSRQGWPYQARGGEILQDGYRHGEAREHHRPLQTLRSPQWINGGKAHGPHVVNNLDIPTDDSEYLLELIRERNWARSFLFVDEVMPRNITVAADNIPYVKMMSVFGLNVHSMLRHQTLVLTEAALNRITEKLLFALHRTDKYDKAVHSKQGHKTGKMEK